MLKNKLFFKVQHHAFYDLLFLYPTTYTLKRAWGWSSEPVLSALLNKYTTASLELLRQEKRRFWEHGKLQSFTCAIKANGKQRRGGALLWYVRVIFIHHHFHIVANFYRTLPRLLHLTMTKIIIHNITPLFLTYIIYRQSIHTVKLIHVDFFTEIIVFKSHDSNLVDKNVCLYEYCYRCLVPRLVRNLLEQSWCSHFHKTCSLGQNN